MSYVYTRNIRKHLLCINVIQYCINVPFRLKRLQVYKYITQNTKGISNPCITLQYYARTHITVLCYIRLYALRL